MTEAPPLIHIEPGAIRETWPLIRARLEAMATKPRMRALWTAEDVYLALMVNQAQLWMTPDAAGFVVLQTVHESYGSDLHVWIANNTADSLADTFMPQLIEIAASMGCHRVTWSSTRAGWQRLFPGIEMEYHYAIRVGVSDGQ